MSSLIKSSATEENPIYDVVIPQHHQRQAGVEFIDALATAVDETAPAATAATETATAETAGAATTVAVVETESSIVETSPSSALPEDSIINPALPECGNYRAINQQLFHLACREQTHSRRTEKTTRRHS